LNRSNCKWKMFVSIAIVVLIVIMTVPVIKNTHHTVNQSVREMAPLVASSNNTTSLANSSSSLNLGVVSAPLIGGLNYLSPSEDYYFVSMLYLPFAAYEFPPTPVLHPVLAEGWTHNANYTVWNLTLKKGLKWDNGSPLNSTDLWYSLEQYLDNGWIYFNITNVKIINSTTVQVTTNIPQPNLVLDWSIYTNGFIMPYQSWSKYDNSEGVMNASFLNYKNIVSDAPFVITNYTPGENPIIFHANKYYYEGQPHMKYVIVRLFSSLASEVEAFRAGTIDALWDWGSYSIVVPLLKGLPGTNLYIPTNVGPYEGVWFNMHQWPYNTTQFRMALAYLTNRTELNNVVNYPNGTMVGYNGLIPSLDQQIGINPSSVNNYPYNPSLAQSLLAQIGIKMDNTSGTANYGLYVYDNPSLPDYGSPVTINITTTQLGFGDIATAVLLEQLWQSAGFKVSVTSLASSPFFSTFLGSTTGWQVAVTIDLTGYAPVALTDEGSMMTQDAATYYNYNSSFGMPNWKVNYMNNLSNASNLYPVDTNQSNRYVAEMANYVDSEVPMIPLWNVINVVASKTGYNWGNTSKYSGIFRPQGMVTPQFFWYGALYNITVTTRTTTPSVISPIVYAGVGVIVVLIVAGAVALAYRSRKRKEKEEK
jgi:peptide/nickel transport system substrate-binding protein